MSNFKQMHIGSCIKEQLLMQGKTTVWLAEQLGCHRTNLYNIYEKSTIDTGVLMRISRILNYNFFELYSEVFRSDEVQKIFLHVQDCTTLTTTLLHVVKLILQSLNHIDRTNYFFNMKRIALSTLLVSLFFSVGFAQKTVITSREFSDTQARLLEVTAKSYIKPLVAEFQVVNNGEFKRFENSYPKTLVEVGMNGNLDNLRSRVIFDATEVYKCDAIVAATFKIELSTDGKFYNVVMKGIPANFVPGSWHPMSEKDYEWIKIDNLGIDAYRDGAAIKNIKK